MKGRSIPAADEELIMRLKFESIAKILAGASVIALSAALPARGQNPKLDLGNLSKLADKADEVVDVTLDGPTLKFAEKFMQDDDDEKDDAEALRIIKNLTGIYVKSFEFDKPDQYSDSDVEAIRAQLKNSSWTRMVNVTSRRREDKEIDEVYVMADPNGKNLGLAVLVAEPKELTVVNIVGPIDADHIALLSGEMGIPDFEHKHEKHGGKHD
jgi:Domain of unknown function (DUF4252)